MVVHVGGRGPGHLARVQGNAASWPGNMVLPSVSGTAQQGQTLTSDNGTWTNTPTSYTYQWYRADPATVGGDVVTYNGSPVYVSATAIPGATSSTYVLTDSDATMIVWILVTAHNATGSGTAESAAVGPVSSGFSLDFTTGALQSGVTASGGANGTRVNSSGTLLVTSAPRFDYNPTSHASRGILIEPAVTNLSVDLSNYSSNNGAASSGVTAPDGSSTSVLWTSSAAGSENALRLYTGSLNGNYQTSILAKLGTGANFLRIRNMNVVTGSGNVWFNLSTGTVGTVETGNTLASMEDLGGGWWRCNTLWVGNNGSPFVDFGVADADASTSAASGHSIYMWAPMIAVSSVVSSHIIPAASVTVARTADAIGFTVPSGVATLTYTFDDNSTQAVSVVSGAYTVPTNLNMPRVKMIVGS